MDHGKTLTTAYIFWVKTINQEQQQVCFHSILVVHSFRSIVSHLVGLLHRFIIFTSQKQNSKAILLIIHHGASILLVVVQSHE